MTQLYFHCSNAKKVFVDHRGTMVEDLAEARDHATRVVQSFTNEAHATHRRMSASNLPSPQRLPFPEDAATKSQRIG
jgi:hypothetical protein